MSIPDSKVHWLNNEINYWVLTFIRLITLFTLLIGFSSLDPPLVIGYHLVAERIYFLYSI